MSSRKRNPWLILCEKLLFRFAFAVCTLFAVVLWSLALAGASIPFSRDSHILVVFFILLFAGLLAIGTLSYFVFQNLTRADYVLSESERWLAHLREGNSPRIRRRKAITRWALWIPTLTVILICTFFDYAWALTSHLLHADAGSLIGYEVPIPFTWSISFREVRSGSAPDSFVVAERYRGLLKAGSGLYFGSRHPPFSISGMQFRSMPAGGPIASRLATAIISVRRLRVGEETVECREEAPPSWMKEPRYVRCSNPAATFFASFHGSNEDAAEFYRVLGSVTTSK